MPFLIPQAFYRRLQVAGHQVGIHLGDSDRTVAEQFRYGLDIHTGHDHMAGKGVAQAVDGQVFNARFLDIALEGLGYKVGQEREGLLTGLLHPLEHIGEDAVERHQPVLARSPLSALGCLGLTLYREFVASASVRRFAPLSPAPRGPARQPPKPRFPLPLTSPLGAARVALNGRRRGTRNR